MWLIPPSPIALLVSVVHSLSFPSHALLVDVVHLTPSPVALSVGMVHLPIALLVGVVHLSPLPIALLVRVAHLSPPSPIALLLVHFCAVEGYTSAQLLGALLPSCWVHFCPVAGYTSAQWLGALLPSCWVHFCPVAGCTSAQLLGALLPSCWVHFCPVAGYTSAQLLDTLLPSCWVHFCPVAGYTSAPLLGAFCVLLLGLIVFAFPHKVHRMSTSCVELLLPTHFCKGSPGFTFWGYTIGCSGSTEIALVNRAVLCGLLSDKRVCRIASYCAYLGVFSCN